MKKSVFSLTIATGIALLPSCSSSNTIPLERQLGIQEPVKLETYADLNLMISQKQSFLLTTYSSTCFCSIDFYNNIEEYQNELYLIHNKFVNKYKIRTINWLK